MMGSVAIAVLVLALVGALVSWAVGAIYYARSLRTLERAERPPLAWLAVIVWPFATKRIAAASADTASVVNKALVALLVCLTLGAATVSYSTNLNRLSR
jgi:cell division protein FtsL